MSIIGGILLVIGVILFFVGQGQKAKGTAMAVADTHTAQLLKEMHGRIAGSVGAEAFQEHCEVKGIIECDHPLTAPLSQTSCVTYKHVVEREYEEEVVETDEEGKRETKVQRGSERVESHDKRVRFWVRDETGRTLVDPNGADMDLKKTGERYDEEQDTSRGKRRTLGYSHTEHALPVGLAVYVLGCAVDFQGEPMMSRHPGDSKAKFLISWKTEQELAQSAESGQRHLQFAAAVVSGLGALLLVGGFLF